MTSAPALPRATYRIQLHPGFGFDDAAELADYLAELGISHLYASPYLQAAPGSEHGYDIVDHAHVNRELGGPEAHARMCEALARHGLGQVVDVVPNHMGVGVSQNAWWWDVLEHGRASRFARYFDVDWERPGDARVLLPILGERYFDALEAGLIRLGREQGRIVVRYRDQHALPPSPQSLAALAKGDPAALDDGALEHVNASLEELDAFLESQNWRLAYWKTATTDLGYRCFFDVATLAGLRVEDPDVFRATHALVLGFVRDGVASGLRIDHPDGLRDPGEYLERLRAAAPSAWIVVEKILAQNEQLPAEWPVDGTTGYEMLYLLDQVQVDASAEAALTELAVEVAGAPQHWDEMARAAKLQVLEETLASERERLAELAHRALARRIELRDCTYHEARVAISELLASYGCYRSYVRPGRAPSSQDVAAIAAALRRASQQQPEIGPRLWSALEDALLLRSDDATDVELALRIQQLTGAVAAKAIEDTLFYRYVRLLALNEVGGAPERFGISVAEFHRALEARGQARGMLATSTHDTKRGEDTRARLLALSQMPEAWRSAVRRWSARSAPYRDGALDGCTEYLFYQTLVGAHPLPVERAWRYMQKAAREAKLHTSWISPEPGYEAALEKFVRGACSDAALLEEIEGLVALLAPVACVISLGRTLIKLTAPGVPDFYRGSELWEQTLVDPDNRQPVDFALRRRLLARVREMTPQAALREPASGAPKLLVVQRMLALRAQRPELFEGAYRALGVAGPEPTTTLAFLRGDRLATVVPLLSARSPLARRTERVRLPTGSWREVFTGAPVAADVAVSELWAHFPVALLVREG